MSSVKPHNIVMQLYNIHLQIALFCNFPCKYCLDKICILWHVSILKDILKG